MVVSELGKNKRNNEQAKAMEKAAAELFDTYMPLIVLLMIPASMLYEYLGDQFRTFTYHMAYPGQLAPPPPPVAPDWSQLAATSFYDLAQREPSAYLALDLGLAFAIGALVFFWKDMMAWVEARRLRASQAGSYRKCQRRPTHDCYRPREQPSLPAAA